MRLLCDCHGTRRTVLALTIPAALLALSACGTTQLPRSPAATPAISADRVRDADRSFIEDQIASQQELLDRQDVLLRTPGHDGQLAAVVKQGTEQLRQDLATLRAVQRQLPPSPAATASVWPTTFSPVHVSASVK